MHEYRTRNRFRNTTRRALSGFLAFLLTSSSILGTPMNAFASVPMLSGNGTAVWSGNVNWSTGIDTVNASGDTVSEDPIVEWVPEFFDDEPTRNIITGKVGNRPEESD